MVTQKSLAVVQARSIAIWLAVLALLLLGVLGVATFANGTHTSSVSPQVAPSMAFPYGPADSHGAKPAPERTPSYGPR